MYTPRSQEASRLRVKKEGDIHLVEFNDRNFLDSAHIANIEAEIAALIEASPTGKFLLDFTYTDHLSAAMHSTLVTLHNKASRRGGTLVIADNEEGQIAALQAMTGSKLKLNLTATRDAAMKQLTVSAGR